MIEIVIGDDVLACIILTIVTCTYVSFSCFREAAQWRHVELLIGIFTRRFIMRLFSIIFGFFFLSADHFVAY